MYLKLTLANIFTSLITSAIAAGCVENRVGNDKKNHATSKGKVTKQSTKN